MAKASNYVNSGSAIITQPEYKEFLHEVKQHIKSNQAKAALAVNSSLIQLYWSIGKLIAEKQTANSWGKNVIEQLSSDLKNEFPGISGFSARNLWDTRRFYLFYTSNHPANLKETSQDQSFIILRQAVAEIPWGHHLLILNKISDPLEAFFYIRQTIEHNWSRTMLAFQIEQKLFSRQGMGMSNFKETLPTPQALTIVRQLVALFHYPFLPQPLSQ